jgi:hypothetical protein
LTFYSFFWGVNFLDKIMDDGLSLIENPPLVETFSPSRFFDLQLVQLPVVK